MDSVVKSKTATSKMAPSGFFDLQTVNLSSVRLAIPFLLL
jgi:hypothetical protein